MRFVTVSVRPIAKQSRVARAFPTPFGLVAALQCRAADRHTLPKVGLIRRAYTVWSVLVGARQQRSSSSANRAQLANAEFSLTEREIVRLIAAAAPLRDRAIVRLLCETGLRRHEAAQLDVDDIELQYRHLVVRNGKGDKLRMVPITTRLAKDLSHLVAMRRGGPVFVSRQGCRLSLRQVNRIVAAAADRAAVRHPNPRYRQVTCHLLRHSFARLWKARHGSIESLSKILGHASVKTTWDVYGTEGWQDVQQHYTQTFNQMFKDKTTQGNRRVHEAE